MSGGDGEGWRGVSGREGGRAVWMGGAGERGKQERKATSL